MRCKSHHYSMQSSRLTLELSPLSAKGWLRSETVAGWKTDVVPKAWRLLEHTLDRHDSASIGWKYRKVRLWIWGLCAEINKLASARSAWSVSWSRTETSRLQRG
jgi:hypothetical protein